MMFLSAENNKILKDFIEEVDDNLVFFVGAGISHSKPAKLPLWNEIVEKLILTAERYCPGKKEEISAINNIFRFNGDIKDINIFLTGIQRLKNVLGENRFFRAIQQMLDCNEKDYPSILYDILLCNPKGIITTNLDTLIESAYAAALHNQDLEGKQEVILTNDYNPAAQLMSRRQWLWKIHGTLSNPKTWVMTLDESYRQINTEKYIESLINVFQNTRIVFVGYSAQDIDLLYVLNKLENRFGSRAKAHILLAKDASEFNIGDFAAKSIDVIEYGGDDSHSNLKKILNGFKKKRQINMKKI